MYEMTSCKNIIQTSCIIIIIIFCFIDLKICHVIGQFTVFKSQKNIFRMLFRRLDTKEKEHFYMSFKYFKYAHLLMYTKRMSTYKTPCSLTTVCPNTL